MTDGVDDPSYFEFITKSASSLSTYINELDPERNVFIQYSYTVSRYSCQFYLRAGAKDQFFFS